MPITAVVQGPNGLSSAWSGARGRSSESTCAPVLVPSTCRMLLFRCFPKCFFVSLAPYPNSNTPWEGQEKPRRAGGLLLPEGYRPFQKGCRALWRKWRTEGWWVASQVRDKKMGNSVRIHSMNEARVYLAPITWQALF